MIVTSSEAGTDEVIDPGVKSVSIVADEVQLAELAELQV